jgi:hypothetical protein
MSLHFYYECVSINSSSFVDNQATVRKLCYTTKLVSTRKAAEVGKPPSPHYHRGVKPPKFHKAEASKVMIQPIW